MLFVYSMPAAYDSSLERNTLDLSVEGAGCRKACALALQVDEVPLSILDGLVAFQARCPSFLCVFKGRQYQRVDAGLAKYVATSSECWPSM